MLTTGSPCYISTLTLTPVLCILEAILWCYTSYHLPVLYGRHCGNEKNNKTNSGMQDNLCYSTSFWQVGQSNWLIRVPNQSFWLLKIFLPGRLLPIETACRLRSYIFDMLSICKLGYRWEPGAYLRWNTLCSSPEGIANAIANRIGCAWHPGRPW